MADFKFVMNDNAKIITDLGFGRMGAVQRFVDSEVAKGMDKYIPFLTGTLKNSVNSSVFGSGRLVYNTPYAKAQFYKGRENQQRGRLWSYRFVEKEGRALQKRVQKFVEDHE